MRGRAEERCTVEQCTTERIPGCHCRLGVSDSKSLCMYLASL